MRWKRKSTGIPTNGRTDSLQPFGEPTVRQGPNPDLCHIGEKNGDLISEAIENLGLKYQDVEFVTDAEQQRAAKPERGGEAAERRGIRRAAASYE